MNFVNKVFKQFDSLSGLVTPQARVLRLTYGLVPLRFLVLVTLHVVGGVKRLLSDVPKGRELKLVESSGCSGPLLKFAAIAAIHSAVSVGRSSMRCWPIRPLRDLGLCLVHLQRTIWGVLVMRRQFRTVVLLVRVRTLRLRT